jgi:hypothetical protein
MAKNSARELKLNMLFPESSRVLLTGTGRQFIERIGLEAARRAVLGVLVGENLRDQTEPLTRQRLAQVSGGIIALFVAGLLENKNFTDQLSDLAIEQIANSRGDTASRWLGQWLIGLTEKSTQNVLRSQDRIERYVSDFESAIEQAASECRSEIGDLSMTLGFIEDGKGQRVELDWRAIAKLTTAIGSQTLTIRGSEKSMYGKLFERLILGSILTILGFERQNSKALTRRTKVFWLSDSSDSRESDATLLVRPGTLARFDIGFIGRGNSEISKDKLTRFGHEIKLAGKTHNSTTFIIVDRLPTTSKTLASAQAIGAEIIQMSMQHWSRDLAQRLGQHYHFRHELQRMPDRKITSYLESKLATIKLQDFLTGISTEPAPEQSE